MTATVLMLIYFSVYWNMYYTTANITRLFHHKTTWTNKIVIPSIILTLLLLCNTTSVSKCHITFYYARRKRLQIHVAYANIIPTILKTRRVCTAEMCHMWMNGSNRKNQRAVSWDRGLRSPIRCLLASGRVCSVHHSTVQQCSFTNLPLALVSHHSLICHVRQSVFHFFYGSVKFTSPC